MKIDDLRVNHVKEPLGFSCDPLSVSWKLRDADGEMDSARIRVIQDGNVVFDSGDDKDADSRDYPIDVKLSPRTEYKWSVSVKTKDGMIAEAESGFETGKMDESWRAKWITSPMDASIPPVFMKKVVLDKRPGKARAYVCGLGLYEVWINGKKAGDEYLAPGYHSYDCHLQVQTIDVTEYLKEGENTICVPVGDGWFRGRLGFDGGYTDLYGNRNYLIFELYVDDELLAYTDEGWGVKPSPITFSNIYDGEVFDARLLEEARSDDGWLGAEIVSAEGNDTSEGSEKAEAGEVSENLRIPRGCGLLVDRVSLPIVMKEEFAVKETIVTPKNETVLDFGQEITGWVVFDAELPEGEGIRLIGSEIMQDGCFYNDNYRSAKAEFTYISDGKRRRVRPHHTFYGFRYMKLEYLDADGNVKKSGSGAGDFMAVHLRSDFDETGEIKIGNELINHLVQNVFWGQKDNFLDVPTDCPQRDERLGWTGDAQIFSETACLNMYMPAFYRKYLWDMRAEQELADGAAPNVVPRIKRDQIGEVGNCPWADAAVIIPWNVYREYGDRTLLRETYPGMKAWLDYERRHEEGLGGAHLVKDGFHFADWLALDNDEPGPFGATDPLFIASAYYYRNAVILSEAAERLGISSDKKEYEGLASDILAALHEKYFDDGVCLQRTQTAAALSLMFGLNPDNASKNKQAAVLAELVHEAGDHLTTGFVGTKELLPALSENGYHGLAVTLLLNEDYPSWLYAVKLGATTIWERWNSVEPDGHLNPDGMNSLNHYSYGSIAGWMYRYLGGIKPVEPGYSKVEITPLKDERLGRFDMRLDTASGVYRSSWKCVDGGKTEYEVSVPFGCEAVFKAGEVEETLTAGTYRFEV